MNEARQYPGDMKHCSDVHKNMHATNGEGDMILKFMWEKCDRPQGRMQDLDRGVLLGKKTSSGKVSPNS